MSSSYTDWLLTNNIFFVALLNSLLHKNEQLNYLDLKDLLWVGLFLSSVIYVKNNFEQTQ